MIVLFTDGGCHNTSTRLGAYAFVCVQIENEEAVYSTTKQGKLLFGASKSQADTTNNIMELLAVSKGLQECNTRGTKLDGIITDSQYVQKGITEWSVNWRKNGWRNGQNQAIANKEIWKDLLENHMPYFVKVWHVRGHEGVYWNEVCDRLCTTAMQSKV